MLAEDLLVLAQETSGTMRQRVPLDVVPWLRETVPPGVSVSVDGDEVRVSVDPPGLARAVGNVLRNAVAAGARRIDVQVLRRTVRRCGGCATTGRASHPSRSTASSTASSA